MGRYLRESGADSILRRPDQQNCGKFVPRRQNDLGWRMHMMGQSHIACAGIQEGEYRKTVRGAGEALDDKPGSGTDDAAAVIDRAEYGVKYQGAPAGQCAARPVPRDMNLHGIAVCHDLTTNVINRGWK